MPKADENRVYSCAFDGYTNIRQEASSKAAAIGKLKNGPEGAEFLGLEGEWTKVSLDGVEDSASSEETFLKINPSGTIGEMKRFPYTSEEEYKQIMKEAEEEEMSIDCFLMTKSEFKGLKKTF